MQFDTDMKSEHKELFLAAQRLLLTFEGFKETKKDRITHIPMKTVEYAI